MSSSKHSNGKAFLVAIIHSRADERRKLVPF